MTKRLNSKHKVDRRLKVNFGADLRALLIKEPMDQVSMVKQRPLSLQIMVFNYKLNRN